MGYRRVGAVERVNRNTKSLVQATKFHYWILGIWELYALSLKLLLYFTFPNVTAHSYIYMTLHWALWGMLFPVPCADFFTFWSLH